MYFCHYHHRFILLNRCVVLRVVSCLGQTVGKILNAPLVVVCGLHVMETPGVAGIVIRPDPTKKHHHLVYTWSDAHEGYPHHDFDDRGPATLRAWSGNDGKLVKKYLCDVGVDADGDHAYPTISTVVFCKL